MSKLSLYKQLEFFGTGNFGEVLKVERKKDKKVFALKKLKIKPGTDKYEEHNKYFKREMEIHATLSHPLIVDYKDHFQDTDGIN